MIKSKKSNLFFIGEDVLLKESSTYNNLKKVVFCTQNDAMYAPYLILLIYSEGYIRQ